MVPTKNLDIRCKHDFVTNANIHHITNQPPLSSIIKSRRLTFFGFSGEACKKVWADRDAVWSVDSTGPN